MDKRLARLITDFQQRVAQVARLLEEVGIQLPTSHHDWILQRGAGRITLPGGIEFLKHGVGFSAGTRSWRINFDFGRHGQLDGFDPWRLWSFGGRRQGRYFASEEELRFAFRLAVQAREIVEVGGTFYLRDPEAE